MAVSVPSLPKVTLDAQFSVTIGWTSSTTTFTFLTASVFANNSPTPEAPKIHVSTGLSFVT